MREPVKCRRCGRVIRFVTTPKGKQMPVDGFSVDVIPWLRGSVFYQENGEPLRAYRVDPGTPGSVKALEPHWYSCPAADELRRNKPRNTAADDALRERIRKAREEQARKDAAKAEKAARAAERRAAEEAQECLFRRDF